jgi:hypothetical protein
MSQLTYCRSSAVAYLLVPYGVHTRGHLDRSGGGGLCGLPVYRYILCTVGIWYCNWNWVQVGVQSVLTTPTGSIESSYDVDL